MSESPAETGGRLDRETAPPTSMRKPLVFISHDSRDAKIAEAFADLLTDASGGILKSFRSSDKKGTTGIEFGSEWYKTIMEKLSLATDSVALLTQRSIDRPWLLYEAGVAKGKLSATVFGVAIGVPLEKAAVGPFAQFQNCADDEESLTKLVLQLISRNPDAAPREEAVRRQVQVFRDALPILLQSQGRREEPQSVDSSAMVKLFEEAKILFRELPGQVEAKLSSVAGSAAPRLALKYDIGFREHLFSSYLETRPANPEVWALCADLVGDALPGFRLLCEEAYCASSTENPQRLNTALDGLQRLMSHYERFPLDFFGEDGFFAVNAARRLLGQFGPGFLPPKLRRDRRSLGESNERPDDSPGRDVRDLPPPPRAR